MIDERKKSFEAFLGMTLQKIGGMRDVIPKRIYRILWKKYDSELFRKGMSIRGIKKEPRFLVLRS